MFTNKLISHYKSHKLLIALLAIVIIEFAPIAESFAATDQFLKVDGLEGDSLAKGHEKWSQISLFSFSVGKKHCAKVFIEKPLDSASPGLSMLAVNGAIVGTATIDVLNNSFGRVSSTFKADLANVTVSSIEINSDDTGVTEQLTLLPQSLTLTFRGQKSDGSLSEPIFSTLNCGK